MERGASLGGEGEWPLNKTLGVIAPKAAMQSRPGRYLNCCFILERGERKEVRQAFTIKSWDIKNLYQSQFSCNTLPPIRPFNLTRTFRIGCI